MIIHAHILTWNEEKQLPITLMHYSSFCDKIFIYDNESTDKTVEIALSYPNVEVIPWNSNNQLNDAEYLKIKNEVWKKSRYIANWVIMCDCDELVYHPDIVSYLEDKEKYEIAVIHPQWWEMLGTSLPGDDVCPVGVAGSSGKALIFNPNWVEEINYVIGAHACHPKGWGNQLICGEIKTLHFKAHSLEYILDRNKQYRDRISELNKQYGWGIHYFFDEKKVSDWYHDLVSSAVPLPDLSV